MAISRGNMPRNICKDGARRIKTYQSTQIQHQKARIRYDTEKQSYAGSHTTVHWPKAGKNKKNRKFQNRKFTF